MGLIQCAPRETNGERENNKAIPIARLVIQNLKENTGSGSQGARPVHGMGRVYQDLTNLLSARIVEFRLMQRKEFAIRMSAPLNSPGNVDLPTFQAE